jgi:hypothetical protein
MDHSHRSHTTHHTRAQYTASSSTDSFCRHLAACCSSEAAGASNSAATAIRWVVVEGTEVVAVSERQEKARTRLSKMQNSSVGGLLNKSGVETPCTHASPKIPAYLK